MNARREVLVWFLFVVAAILISLALVTSAIRLTFASAAPLDLTVATVQPSVADYSRDEPAAVQQSLHEAVVGEAGRDSVALQQANAEWADRTLPTLEGPINLLTLLLASPTAIPTQLIKVPPTATLSATQTVAATATLRPSVTASASRTWTATSTSQPTDSTAATFTADASVTLSASPSVSGTVNSQTETPVSPP